MKSHSTIMPAVFVGHGSPMNLKLDNPFTGDLKKLGDALPLPKAILVVSAHWLSEGSFVTCTERPRQIYDFYGFPEDLYKIVYGCPGAPAEADLVVSNVSGGRVQCDRRWGLDHASWAVLKHMYPAASIPVFEFSLDVTRPPRYHYELGRELGFLREQGVLVIGSGNIVHNLRRLDYDMYAPVFDWAETFDGQVKKALLRGDHDWLVSYEKHGHAAELSIPTNDHYLPMLYVIALQREREKIEFVHEGFQHGSISMRCFTVG